MFIVEVPRRVNNLSIVAQSLSWARIQVCWLTGLVLHLLQHSGAQKKKTKPEKKLVPVELMKETI